MLCPRIVNIVEEHDVTCTLPRNRRKSSPVSRNEMGSVGYNSTTNFVKISFI